MLKAKSKAAGCRISVGKDKAYDTADHAANLRAKNVTPHVTQNDSLTKTGQRRKSAIDARTTRHPGYGMPANAARDDRMHLWLGQAAWHHAQDQASRRPSRRGRLD